ncbi:GIY-YIG nuclease family protein [Streptomyces sp. NPDC001953]
MSVANMQEDQRPAAVYRLWDRDGNLLYIGSSYNPEERAKAHHRAEWGPLIARRTDEWRDSREDAYDAEGRAIAAENPAHNVAGTPRHTGPAERGRVQREASEARWRAAIAAIRAGTPVTEARRAGGWAEVEYLEASGLLPSLAAKWRREMEEYGGTYNSNNMSLPAAVNGRLTWEMRPSEPRVLHAAGQLPGSDGYPNSDRWARLERILGG